MMVRFEIKLKFYFYKMHFFPEGKTPLHLAILKQNFDCVKKLITKRANVHKIYGSTGDTVLHFAVREKCCAILNYLLHETEARIDQENYSQITPLQLSKILMEEADEKSLEIYNIIKDYVCMMTCTNLLISFINILGERSRACRQFY